MTTRLCPRLLVLGSLLVGACGDADEPTGGGSSGGSSTVAAESGTGADASSTAVAETGAVDTGASSSDGGSSSSGGVPLTGEELFLESCSPCHGVEGEGTTLAYAIQHPLREYSRWVVRNGRPQGTEFPDAVMLPFGEDKLDDAQLELIFDYLDSFPQPADGQGLFMDYCRNCHGVDAAGGVVGVDIREEVYEALEKVREGEGNDIANRMEFMPVFSEERLSDAEVAAIVEYVAGL